MYHRYMRSENGSFQRLRIADPQPPEAKLKKASPPEHKGEAAAPQLRFQLPFLEKLLPNADSGDILVLLILLLLLAEGNEDSSTVILTLVIFLFLQ